MTEKQKYSKDADGIFLGIGEGGEPVYLPYSPGTGMKHIQVVGTTGSGKGVSLGLMSSQFFSLGEAVFFCDPKNDEWAPHLLAQTAKENGKPYYFINLSEPNGPQLDLMSGSTWYEAFELFQAGLGLTDKGDTSDFYGIQDRRQARETAKLMAKKGLNIAQAYAAREDILNDEATGAKKFAGRLLEMAETPSINALPGQGVNLEKVIEEGGCVYIVGSMRNDIVKTVQRMLLVRLIQLAERRDRMKGGIRPVCIVLDEVKYHLSKPAQEALGAARDKGVHVILAHQSLGDLRDCTKDMNPDAVVDAIVENCWYKLCYRVMNPDTAEWLARMSGTIQVDDESRTVIRNLMQAEIVTPERTIRQNERHLVDVNMLMSLAPGVGVLYGNGLPQFVSIRPIPTTKTKEAITPIIVDGTEVESGEDAIGI